MQKSYFRFELNFYFFLRSIEKKYWPGTESKDQNFSKEFQEEIMKKLMTLLFKNLLFPIIRSPESESVLSNISETLRYNLYNIANFLDKVTDRENLMGGELMRELNSFIRYQWDSLAKIIFVK